MSLCFFVDQCVPQTVSAALKRADFTAFVLRDFIPTDSPDPLVLKKAQELKAVFISLNGDFSDIVNYPPAHYGGIISLQLHNHPEILPQLLVRLIDYLRNHPNAEDYSGRLFLIEAHRIRIRG